MSEQDSPKKLIMLVDDDHRLLQAMEALLADEYKVLAYHSARDALEAAQENQDIALVMMDVDMPGLNGYEACAELKSSPSTAHLPLMFVTGKDDPAHEIKGLDLGAVDYVPKPFNLQSLRARIKHQVEVHHERQHLKKLSQTDGLTNLANRSALDDHLHHHWNAAQRTLQPFSVLMIDLDNFKAFNDHYGHQGGDFCLQTVAESLAEIKLRDTDLLGRYGGEEFMLVLPYTDLAGAKLMASQVLEAIAEKAIPHEGNPDWQQVTASVGVCTAVPDTETKILASLDLIVAEADAQLYRSKKAGRNRLSYIEVDLSLVA